MMYNIVRDKRFIFCGFICSEIWGNRNMKKRMACLIVLLTLITAGCASATVSSLSFFDMVPEYSTEELLQLRTLIDEELKKRDVSVETATPEQPTYILNINSKKFHIPSCESVGRTKEENKREFFGTREELIELRYQPCGSCNP